MRSAAAMRHDPVLGSTFHGMSSGEVASLGGSTATGPQSRLLLFAVVGASGLALGVLTSFGQIWLPDEAHSVANSAGSWALVAFLFGLLAFTAWVAAVCGTGALLALLAGYLIASTVRDFGVSSTMVVFWSIAGLTVGPFLGLGAYWLRRGHATLAPLSLAAMSGVLIGEGVYGLRYVADTTYPPFWWGELALGVTLLVVGAVRWLDSLAAAAVAALTSLLVAGAFVAVYSQGIFIG